MVFPFEEGIKSDSASFTKGSFFLVIAADMTLQSFIQFKSFVTESTRVWFGNDWILPWILRFLRVVVGIKVPLEE